MNLYAFIFLIVGVAFLVGLYGERWRARSARRKWQNRAAVQRGVTPFRRPATAPVTDSADQLRVVMAATFATQPLLSKAEAYWLYAAERAIDERKLTWRVMAQVSLGEVLSSPDASAYAAINSKRVDLLIISSRGLPIAAIEYQGAGHYQGTAPARDAVKKEALRRAGVRYIEMTPEHDADDLVREIARLVAMAGERIPSARGQ